MQSSYTSNNTFHMVQQCMALMCIVLCSNFACQYSEDILSEDIQKLCEYEWYVDDIFTCVVFLGVQHILAKESKALSVSLNNLGANCKNLSGDHTYRSSHPEWLKCKVNMSLGYIRDNKAF